MAGEPLTVYPFLRYQDCPAAIDWLEKAFGFQRVQVHEGEGGRIEHAELSVGDRVIMLGSTRDGAAPDSPGASGEVKLDGVSQGVYIAVDDPDAHHDRAQAAGARIIWELQDTDYGSRDYTALDPEGFVWSFGTYRPGVGG